MAFTHQVGGHDSTILASPLSSSTLIKPASPRELAFYQHLGPSLADGEFVGLWTPAFYGTLKLEGRVAQNGSVDKLEDPHVEPEMLVLENLTHRFVRPNVLDVKLGTVLYDEDASPEKQQRMRKAAESSTSGTTGIRLTGFQVWDTTSQSYHKTSKSFGRTLLSHELPRGLSRFFYPPLSALSTAEKSSSSSTSPSSSSASTPSSASSSTSSTPIPPASHPHPLPLDLLLPVLRTLVRRLDTLSALLSTLEVRIRGGSLLFIVEGDPDALEAALVRSQQPDEDEDSDAESVSTTDGDGNAAPHTRQAFEMRLIDFAHTRDATGEGCDEGVVLGVRTLRRLIGELVAELEAKQAQEREGKEARN
ncbi:hypothetical protein JCM1840_005433 [Sporobolomyces johnsonii]